MKNFNSLSLLLLSVIFLGFGCTPESDPIPDPEINQRVILQLDIDPGLQSIPEGESYTLQITLEVGVQDKNSLDIVNKEFQETLSYSITGFFTDEVPKNYEVQFPVRKNSQQIYYSYNVTILSDDRIEAGVSEYSTFEPTETEKTIRIVF